jgi:predicted MFS family arabinose efflux permease
MILKTLSKFTDSFRGLPREVWLLSCVSLINRSGAMVICFLTLYLTKSLHFDIKSAGYIMSCFGLGSITGAYFGGVLTDKYGYYRVQWFTLVMHGVLLWAMMFISEFYTLAFGMLLIGIFSEAFRPANTVAIKLHSEVATRTRSMSLMRVAVNLAISVALIVGGLLVSLGWNWLFIVDGLTCFGAAAMLLFSLKEKKTVPEDLPKPSKKSNLPPQYNSDISAYKDKKYLLFVFSTFLGATVFMQIMWTVPAFFSQVYGWNEAKIGVMSAVNGIAVMTLEMPLIFRIEHKRPPMWFVRLGILCYMTAYLAFTLPASVGWFLAIFYMIIISLGEIFVMPFSTSWATKQGSMARQGQYLALYTMAYSVSNVVAPMLGTQVIAAWGFTALWFLLSGLGVLAFSGFWYLEKVSAKPRLTISN